MPTIIVPIMVNGPPATEAGGGETSNNTAGQVFHPFPHLPPELRQQIWLEAFRPSFVAYFSLKSKHFAGTRPILLMKARKGRGVPTFKGWAELSQVCHEVKSAVDRAVAKYEPRAFEEAAKNPAVTYQNTLVVLDLKGKNGRTIYPWNEDATKQDNTRYNAIYNSLGRGVRYLGIRWQPQRAPCRGHAEAFREFAGEPVTQPAQHYLQALQGGFKCGGQRPCLGMLKGYVRYFRDAEVMYVMVHVPANDLRRREPERIKTGVVQRFTDEVIRLQKAKNLHRWEDGNFTWYELETKDAEAFISPRCLQPWVMARYLRTFYDHIDAETKQGTNPDMTFRVLVTTTKLQRKEEEKVPEKGSEPCL